MSASDKANSIILMVPIKTPEERELPDRLGAKTHGLEKLKEVIYGRLAEPRNIDPETLRQNIEQCITQVGQVISKVSQNVSGPWELESVSVSLSINAEGSIGIATVGVETGFEVNFTPRK